MKLWIFLLLLCCVTPSRATDQSPLSVAATPPLQSINPRDEYAYYRFEEENSDGYLSIELTLRKNKVVKCEILYRTKASNSNEDTPVKTCSYDAQNKTLTAEFKKNNVGLVRVISRLNNDKQQLLWQRVLETVLTFTDNKTVKMKAGELGRYFLQNKQNCELEFTGERSGRHEFREGVKEIEITLAYDRASEAFIRKWMGPDAALLTRDTDYSASSEKYRFRLPAKANIIDELTRASLEPTILCASYEDVKD
jgi:hypothetical protein